MSLTSNFLTFMELYPRLDSSSFFTNAALLLQQARWNALANFSLHLVAVNTFSSSNSFWGLYTVVYFFNNILISVFFIFIVFFLLTYGGKIIKTMSSAFDINITVFTYFTDLEEEMGSVDDSLIYYLLFAGIIVWFFFITLFTVFFTQQLSWVLVLLFILSFTAFIIPASVLKNYGLAFVAYVRGHGRTSSFIFEAILDFVAVTVISLRFVVQNVRFLIIFAAFFELYEFVYSSLNNTLLFGSVLNTDAMSNFLTNVYWVETLINLFITWVLYLYYLGHLTIVFVTQLAVYFALSFWLFFFLYTTFVLNSSEKYFFFKKNL